MLAESKLWKRVKAWWDAYKIIASVMAIVAGISGSAGYYGKELMTAAAPAPVAAAPAPPQACTVIEQITCPTVVCACDAAIKEHARKHKKEHW